LRLGTVSDITITAEDSVVVVSFVVVDHYVWFCFCLVILEISAFEPLSADILIGFGMGLHISLFSSDLILMSDYTSSRIINMRRHKIFPMLKETLFILSTVKVAQKSCQDAARFKSSGMLYCIIG
jgi:hypothetical protein